MDETELEGVGECAVKRREEGSMQGQRELVGSIVEVSFAVNISLNSSLTLHAPNRCTVHPKP